MKGYSNKSLSRFLDRLVTINHVEGKDNSKNSKLAAKLTYAYIGTRYCSSIRNPDVVLQQHYTSCNLFVH